MTRFILLLCIAMINATAAFSQKEFSNKPYWAGAYVFSPTQIPGNEFYFNDSWLSQLVGYPKEKLSREYNRVGFGVEFGKTLGENSALVLCLGYANRDIHEARGFTGSTAVVPGQLHYEESTSDYNQKNFQASVFYQVSAQVSKLEIYGGLGATFLSQGKGHQKFYSMSVTGSNFPEMYDTTALRLERNFGSSNHVGIAFRTGFLVHLLPSIDLGADISSSLLYSFSNQPYSEKGSYITVVTTPDGNMQPVTVKNEENGSNTSTLEFKQFSFSHFAPSLRLLFRF